MLVTTGHTPILDEAYDRVNAELRSIGVTTTYRQLEGPAPSCELLARQLASGDWTAALLVTQAASGEPTDAENYGVCAYDAVRKRLVTEALVIDPSETTSAAATLAIKSLEVLRAALLVFDTPPARVERPRRPSGASDSSPGSERRASWRYWSLGMGTVLDWQAGLGQPSLSPTFLAGYARPAWTMALVLSPFASSVRVHTNTQTGHLRKDSLALQATLPLLRRSFAPYLIVRGGAALLTFEGESSEHFVAVSARSVVGFGAAGIGLSWRTRARWLFAGDVSGALAPAAPRLRLGTEVQAVGRWALITTLTTQVSL